MDNKLQQMQDIMKLQQTIARAKEDSAKKITVTEVNDTIVEQKEVENTLPTTFISANQLKLTAKEIAHTTSYLDRLKQSDERYDAVKISEDKAKKIMRSLTRLTTGSSSVVPLKCKGSECAFKTTCLTGDTLVLTKKGHIRLDSITVGTKLYSYSLDKHLIEEDTVTAFNSMGLRDVFRITTKYGNTIVATGDHPFLSYVEDFYDWRTIDEGLLTIGSAVIVEDFNPAYLETIESLGDGYIDYIVDIEYLDQAEVYDITVKTNENFIANNFVVHNCPYYLEGVAPLNLACLVELQLIEYWMEKYQTEFNVENDSITDMHMISRLCEYDIYDMRVTRYLAENDQTLLVDFISSYDEQNNPISNKATSAAFEVKERIDRLRSKTLKELMATREAKAKIMTTVVNNSSNLSLAGLKQKYDELVKDHTTLKPMGAN